MRKRPGRVRRFEMADLRPRPAAALRLRNRGDDLGRDRRALRGRDPRAQRADLRGRGPPLRAGPARGPRARRRPRVRRSPSTASERWPEPGLGAAAEPDPDPRRGPARHPLRLLPGGAAAREALHRSRKDDARRWPELDALHVLAEQMTRDDREEWPEQLFLLGDQVYVDEGSPRTREKIRDRRGTDDRTGRGGDRLRGVHLALPREPGAEPLIRWLFSTVSISMALGRPRHERRLEHLPLLASRRCGSARPGGSERTIAGDRPATGSTSTSATSRPGELDEDELYGDGPRQPATSTRKLREWADGDRADRRRARAGASAATSAARGRSSSTRGAGRTFEGERRRWSTTKSGTGSSSMPRATSTTC